MSTTTATHHHFPTSIALAAASVVVVGGLTAVGIAAAQDDATTAPSTSQAKTYTQHQQCPDPRCMPQQPRGGSHNSRSVDLGVNRGQDSVSPPFGGRTMPGMP